MKYLTFLALIGMAMGQTTGVTSWEGHSYGGGTFWKFIGEVPLISSDVAPEPQEFGYVTIADGRLLDSPPVVFSWVHMDLSMCGKTLEVGHTSKKIADLFPEECLPANSNKDWCVEKCN